MSNQELAEKIAEKIEYEEGVVKAADWELHRVDAWCEEPGMTEEEVIEARRRARHRKSQLTRDKNRALSKLLAYTETLDLVLGGEMSAATYLYHRRTAA